MNFFQAQEDARKRTRRLVIYFSLCVIGVVVAVEVILGLVLGAMAQDKPAELGAILLVVGFGTAGVILLGSLYKSFALRSGGAVVARDLGGRLILSNTRDFGERRLLNVVEEMAIASGTPVPQVYLMDGEPGINAFAAGTEPSNAVIGVTQGCLERLNREELQGVVAHEFSHILNGDMRLNMRLIGMVFGLVLITIIGRGLANIVRYVESGRRGKDNNGLAIVVVIALVGVVLMLVGSLGSFFARLLQAAVSRQREFLADASAVQFTRDPMGISGALRKIGGQTYGSKMISPKAVEASHLFFADGGLFAYGMATHPPLKVRIKAIDDSWDGSFLTSELPPLRSGAMKPPPLPKGSAAAQVAMLDQLGDSALVSVERGRAVVDELDDEARRAVEDRAAAQALLLGMLVADDEVLRGGELAALHGSLGPEATAEAAGWNRKLRGVHSARKIALIDLSLPALRGMSDEEYRRFVSLTRQLIASDGRISLFEFMVQHLLKRHLESHFEVRGFPPIKARSLQALGRDGVLVLSAMAWEGRDEDAARDAWESMLAHWPEEGGWRPVLLEREECRPARLGAALDRCEEASPIVKRDLLALGGRAAARDEVLSSREIELLRLVADAIGAGVPPLIDRLQLG